MKEYHLQMAWKLSVLAGKKLITTQGEKLEIISPGYGPTEEGGPDFTMAKIKLNDTVWVGSIEVHVQSSLWYSHRHSGDPKYDNTVLHVVWEQDKEVVGNQGDVLPCIELKEHIPLSWFERIDNNILAQPILPCGAFFSSVPSIVINTQLDVMLVERIEQRLLKIEEVFIGCECNWDETLHRFVASYMGQKANNFAMEVLAKSLSFKIIQKHRNSLEDIEALLFGQGGFLEVEYDDVYFRNLKERYTHLSFKYSLTIPIGIQQQWQYKGVRPASFPEQCIAKWANVLFSQDRLLNWVVTEDVRVLLNQHYSLGDYWKLHLRFGQLKSRNTQGASFSQLLINVIIPFRIAYKRNIEEVDVSAMLEYYEEVKAEENKVISYFKQVGYLCKTSRDSQALLQLFNYYCNYKKCLSCKVGHYILKKEGLL